VHIAALSAYCVRIPLRRAVRHAAHSRNSTDNVVVRCVLGDGTVGWGECVPRDYVTGETADSVLAVLRTSELGRQVEPVGVLSDLPAQIAHLKLEGPVDDDRAIRTNAARCALELAVLDAFCRHFREPLSTITRLLAPELYQPSDRVHYSGAITSTAGLKLRFQSWAYRLFGFEQIKVKVGLSGQDDVCRLRCIRKRVGSRVRLRIDANEAWTPETAVQRIQELEPFTVDSIEQPLPHRFAGDLPALRQQISTPVMLDESMCGEIDAQRAVRDNLCDQFNLRLSKCGGFFATLRLAQFARRSGIKCQLGCQVGETSILSAAGRHFASSVRGLMAVEGSFDRHLVREALSERDITFGRGGWAPALQGFGLGIQIDPQALARVTIRQEQLLD
jgi:L-Ala-D/L-Glu epimerase